MLRVSIRGLPCVVLHGWPPARYPATDRPRGSSRRHAYLPPHERLITVELRQSGTGFQPVRAAEHELHTHTKGVESIYRALILGIRDYFRKCGFRSAVVDWPAEYS